MTKPEYMEFHEKCCAKMVEVTRKKNADYTGTSDDPFFNFTRVEAIGIVSTEQGFLTRMYDKFARITTFVQKGVLLVADESIEDTLIDLANYCILMAGYIRSKKMADKKYFIPAGTKVDSAAHLNELVAAGKITVHHKENA